MGTQVCCESRCIITVIIQGLEKMQLGPIPVAVAQPTVATPSIVPWQALYQTCIRTIAHIRTNKYAQAVQYV